MRAKKIMKNARSVVRIGDIEVSSTVENITQVAKTAERLSKGSFGPPMMSRHEQNEEDQEIRELEDIMGYSFHDSSIGRHILSLAKDYSFDRQKLNELMDKAKEFGAWNIDLGLNIDIDLVNKKISSELDVNKLKKELKKVFYQIQNNHNVYGLILVVITGKNVDNDTFCMIKDQFRVAAGNAETMVAWKKEDKPMSKITLEITSIAEFDKYCLEDE